MKPLLFLRLEAFTIFISILFIIYIYLHIIVPCDPKKNNCVSFFCIVPIITFGLCTAEVPITASSFPA